MPDNESNQSDSDNAGGEAQSPPETTVSWPQFPDNECVKGDYDPPRDWFPPSRDRS
jgi:hypothetical protein